MLNHDPFNINKDVILFTEEVRKHLTTIDEVNKAISIFRQVSLCNTLLNMSPNLNHSTYIKGFIYDVLNSIIAIIKKRERYLQLNFRSMVEHIARITLNKINNGVEFDQTVRTRDFNYLKTNVTDEGWSYLHDVYINACHYIHSSPQANLDITSSFLSLINGDSNSNQHNMMTKLQKVVSALMKIIIKHYHTSFSNIFFRNRKHLEKIMGKSLHAHYLTFDD